MANEIACLNIEIPDKVDDPFTPNRSNEATILKIENVKLAPRMELGSR